MGTGIDTEAEILTEMWRPMKWEQGELMRGQVNRIWKLLLSLSDFTLHQEELDKFEGWHGSEVRGGHGQRTPSLSGTVRNWKHLSLPSTSSTPTHHLRSSSRLTSLCSVLLPLNSHLHCDPHHARWYVVTDALHHKGSHAALVLFPSWKQGTLP